MCRTRARRGAYGFNMPEINGVEATRQIKQENPKTQVIILTSYLEDEHILPALRSGACRIF
jgi:DNA-binding NarL/FixJ family response regulator